MAEVDHNWNDKVSSQQGAEKVGISKKTYERDVRQDWTREEVESLYELSFNELIFRAQSVHRQYFNPDQVQLSRLLSIKTGGCPEDCAYCPQSARYQTDVAADKLLTVDTILAEAQRAKDGGASRFCMGAAWRSPKDRDISRRGSHPPALEFTDLSSEKGSPRLHT